MDRLTLLLKQVFISTGYFVSFNSAALLDFVVKLQFVLSNILHHLLRVIIHIKQW